MKNVFQAVTGAFAWIGTLSSTKLNGFKQDDAMLSSIPGIIPGDSNLQICPESRDAYLFSVERISVYPTPPPLVHANSSIDEYIDIYLYGIAPPPYQAPSLPILTLAGTFLQNITLNATWEWTVDVQRGPDHGHESGIRDFCDVMGGIEQPDPHRGRDCPPEKGWANMHAGSFLPWWLGSVG
ncbi:hypothetical protein DL98DRAFT_589021 [Cadophora sp. DSE1049]|nr:hypothetical protein DL98DRAFT_589021 [Cadophora sp. DSE1049]